MYRNIQGPPAVINIILTKNVSYIDLRPGTPFSLRGWK
jgi:hypothetical protein